MKPKYSVGDVLVHNYGMGVVSEVIQAQQTHYEGQYHPNKKPEIVSVVRYRFHQQGNSNSANGGLQPTWDVNEQEIVGKLEIKKD